MSKHSLYHQESRLTQALQRWDSETTERDLAMLSRASRNLRKTAIRLARKADIDDGVYSND